MSPLDDAQMWVKQRMTTRRQPRDSDIDAVSTEFAKRMYAHVPRLYRLLHAIQANRGMNVQIYISSIMYFADACDWQEQRE